METKKYYCEYRTIVEDILTHETFQKLKEIDHHGNGLYEHSVAVGYYSYCIAKYLKLDAVSIARGATLHDFFLEPWQEKVQSEKGWKKFAEMHAFSHPKAALRNAMKYFEIDARQADMIVKHMFPLTPIPPTNLGSWIVTSVDKVVAAKELMTETVQPVNRIKKVKSLLAEMHWFG